MIVISRFIIPITHVNSFPLLGYKQTSSGIFTHLKGAAAYMGGQEPTPDLNPETLNTLAALMLAQAQEIFVTKAIQDKMKDAIVAKVRSLFFLFNVCTLTNAHKYMENKEFLFIF